MLGRKLAGSASFVCLRCRLQLAGAPKRVSFPAVTYSSALRSTGRHLASHSGLPGADDPNGWPDDGASTEPSSSTDPYSSAESKDWVDSRSEGIGASRSPPLSRKRTYKSRGHLVAPEPEGLSINILGKPGSAIVLREKRRVDKKPRFPRLTPDNDRENDPVDTASLLAVASADAASDDVLLNIHELKPRETSILTDKEFRKLKDTLVGGFTSTQLTLYIRDHQEAQRLGQEGARAAEDAPWVLERQPWAPIVPNALQDVEPHLQGYISRGMAPKERLAIRLMRECWDVSNQKILDKDGYASLRLRDVEFSLLTLGNRRWLEGTPRTILAHVKEVKLTRENRVLSVVAPKHAADSILARVHNILLSARTVEFAADLVSPEALERKVLEEVGRASNTVTRLDPSGKNVVVTWIHKAERNENWENAADIVLRFLRDAYGPRARLSSGMHIVSSDPTNGGQYFPVLNSSEKLPWQARSTNWERWTEALSKMRSTSDTQGPLIPTEALTLPLDSGLPTQGPKTLSSTMPGWSSEPITATKAVFGHVVFAQQKQSSSSSPIVSLNSEPARQPDAFRDRTFIPVLPALGSLALTNNLKEVGLWHSTVVIRFAPSPDLPPELVASAPDLELHMDADHQEVKSLISLRAIQQTHTSDVLFPAAPADAQLVQQRYFTLPGTSIEHHVPSLLTFLSRSDLRPHHAKISTPARVSGVRLPRRFLASAKVINNNNNNTDSSTSTPADADPAADDAIQLDYALAWIEIQRTVAAEYEGLKLRYRSIQGGQHSGERAELSLEAVRVEPTPESLLQAEEEKSDLYQIVDEDDFRQQLGPKGPKFVTHHLNTGETADSQLSKSARPVEVEEFIRVASGIVNETGGFKWHAKRS
ncbi:hypothetical protein VTI74DRAFT_3858 [Chaetomium olivicolor]